MLRRASELTLPDESLAVRLARVVRDEGGCALVVGGWVRDQLLGRQARDVDLEVHGLSRSDFDAVVERFAPTREVGRAFPVHRLGKPPIQVGFAPPEGDLEASFARAARRRDLRINSLGWDPLSGRLLDPHHGLRDLTDGRLAFVDAETFADDPLRVFRVARLAAVLEFDIDPALREVCLGLPLAEIAVERIYEELMRWLLDAARPSLGLVALRDLGTFSLLTPLAALEGVPQDPTWHPEGDVFVHTAMVLDAAAGLRVGDAREDADLMWSALCHDLGKPDTTEERDGRVVSPGHAQRSAEITRAWLSSLRAPHAASERVARLVAEHLLPSQLVKQGATGRGYRRLARRLADAGTDAFVLERLARADQLGRTTEDARAGRFAEGDAFLAAMQRHVSADAAPNRDVVQGRHVLARGLATGRAVGEWLRRCREIQDDTGLRDPDAILDRAIAQTQDK